MIKIEGLEAISSKLMSIDNSLAQEIISKVTQDAFSNVKNRAKKHYVTGTMENNIFRIISKKSLTGVVGIEDNGMMVDLKGKSVNYAIFVLYGTKPHTIKPKDKKAIRYPSVNSFVFSKSVQHPGYKGDNFLNDGVEDTYKNIDSIISRITDDWLQIY